MRKPKIKDIYSREYQEFVVLEVLTNSVALATKNQSDIFWVTKELLDKHFTWTGSFA